MTLNLIILSVILLINLGIFIYARPMARLNIKLARAFGTSEAIAGRSEEEAIRRVRQMAVLTSVTACVVLLVF